MAENAGSIYYDIEMDVQGLLTSQQRVNQRLDLMERGFDKTSRSIDTTERSMSSLSRVAVALTAALSVQQVAEYADAWATVNNKLSNSLRPSEQLADVTERVFNITQQTRSSLDATASLYARLERATRQYGTSAGDLAKLTTIINQGFVVSGATAQEAENAIIQLSQGLASGALRGEEFNSVNEQGNRLIVALADSMGVSIGQMRNMAAQGKLTTDVVVNGLLSQGSVIGAEFANTTTTISQALQVAGNNITKFFGENSTVKTGAAIFSDAVVTISENIGGLSALLTGVAAILGSRYVGALTMATAAKIKAAAASRTLSAEESLAAQAAANKAAADLRAAAVAKERALDEMRLAEMMRLTAISETNAAAAEQRLSVARVAAAGAVDNYNRALAANRAAQMALSTGASLASRALGLIGGPAGAAMLAASAILYFSQRAKEARNDANALADSVNDLSSKFQTMSHTELAATIGKLSQSLPELSDAVSDAQKEFNDATSAVQRQQREIANWGTNTTRGRQAAEALGGAQDNLAIATLELEKAQNRLSQTQNAINIGRATLNGTMKQGIDLLRRDGQEAGIAAGMMSKLGDMINFAAKAKDKFNSSSLMVERPKDVQEYLDKLQDQVTLQSEINDRKRAQLRAEQDIRKLGGSEADVNLARDRAAAEFDAQQAQQNNKKATKDATAEAKKAETQEQRNVKVLEEYSQKANLSADSTSDLSREQAILAAKQKLTNATPQQIAQVERDAAAAWDKVAALKAQNAVPILKENADYAAERKTLDSLKDQKDTNGQLIISQEQYNQASEELEQKHQVALAKIRAGQVVTPQQQAQGEVDPVRRLANQHAQELALIQQFETQKGQITANGLALMNAANTQYEQQRIAAQWALFTQQSIGYEALGAAVDAFGSQASNALTGVITGSMSANDALRSIGNTILNDVIDTFVQMGIQQAKSAIMGATAQNAAIATTTAAQVGGLATTTAASTASAGTTMAAWLPAALVASVGSFGAAAIIGGAALVGAFALSKTLAGGRKNGGPVSAGSMYQVGEGGMPEIYKASNGSQYMIPGDNGSVISNKDLRGSGGVGSSPNIQIIVQNNNGSDVRTSASKGLTGQDVINIIISDAQQSGPATRAIAARTGSRLRATGDY
ncbi:MULTISPECIES: tape measure protein [unclassified Raoultella]|uniref:tape measure protein n=2 Tax=unclassified Raoultella TaxID=2627600 RepID=UPI00135CF1FF|nr:MULTISPECIES: tape measure protein [unclassified Raoultella]